MISSAVNFRNSSWMPRQSFIKVSASPAKNPTPAPFLSTCASTESYRTAEMRLGVAFDIVCFNLKFLVPKSRPVWHAILFTCRNGARKRRERDRVTKTKICFLSHALSSASCCTYRKMPAGWGPGHECVIWRIPSLCSDKLLNAASRVSSWT